MSERACQSRPCCVSRTETCTLLAHYAIFLVICAPSIALNSTLDQRVVEQALEEIRHLRRENGFPNSETTRLDQRRRITRETTEPPTPTEFTRPTENS